MATSLVFLAHPESALAVAVANACRNSVTANNSQITVNTTGAATSPVPAGGTITLSSLQQSGNLPGAIFVAGYNLGLLQEGQNSVPAQVLTWIEGTNTTDGTKTSSLESTVITVTINDPDNSPGTGDETATDGTFTVSYDNMTFTAGASPGTAEFRQDTIYPLAASQEFAETGSLIVRALIAGIFKVRFACSPGTVTPPDPGTVTAIDPAASFATTTIVAGMNQAPTANAGSDQMVASGAVVNLDGTGSSDPDADPLTYAWTQTGGPSVSLTGAATAMPSFTAPTGPAVLTFQLEVCDAEPLCDTDTVTITVDSPASSSTSTSTSSSSSSTSSTSTSSTSTSTSSTTSTSQPVVCRMPTFWGTHAEANPRKPNSKDITGAFLPVTVCGITLNNTGVGVCNSAQETLCVARRGEPILQLARQLTAAELNCNVATCPNAILNLLADCNQECINNDDPQAIGECIEDIDAFNNGVSPDAFGCHARPITGFTPPGPAGSSGDCQLATQNDVTIFDCP